MGLRQVKWVDWLSRRFEAFDTKLLFNPPVPSRILDSKEESFSCDLKWLATTKCGWMLRNGQPCGKPCAGCYDDGNLQKWNVQWYCEEHLAVVREMLKPRYVER